MKTLKGLKRQAKKVCREQNLTHCQALDLLAQKNGFDDFFHAKKHTPSINPKHSNKNKDLKLLLGQNYSPIVLNKEGQSLKFDHFIIQNINGKELTIYIDFLSESEIEAIPKSKDILKLAKIIRFNIPYLCLPIEWIHLKYNVQSNVAPFDYDQNLAHYALEHLSGAIGSYNLSLDYIQNSIQNNIIRTGFSFAEFKKHGMNGLRKYLMLIESNEGCYCATSSLIVKNLDNLSEGYFLNPIFETVVRTKLHLGTTLLGKDKISNHSVKRYQRSEMLRILNEKTDKWNTLSYNNDFWELPITETVVSEKNSDSYQGALEDEHRCSECGGLCRSIDKPSFYSEFNFSLFLECMYCGHTFTKQASAY